jgi:hypothetical protein
MKISTRHSEMSAHANTDGDQVVPGTTPYPVFNSNPPRIHHKGSVGATEFLSLRGRRETGARMERRRLVCMVSARTTEGRRSTPS